MRGRQSSQRLLAGAIPVLMCAHCLAGTGEVSRVIDGCGGWVTGAHGVAYIAAAQPAPVGLSSNAVFVNCAGFLRTFDMNPPRDTDADGIDDETDTDDDGDALPDLVELDGGAFEPGTVTDPLQADVDGDGMDDGEEAVAGTDPWSGSSVLRILSIESDGGTAMLSWQSRGGRTYDLVAASAVSALSTNGSTVVTVTAEGGVAPWFETVTAVTSPAAPQRLYYRVRVSSGGFERNEKALQQ